MKFQSIQFFCITKHLLFSQLEYQRHTQLAPEHSQIFFCLFNQTKQTFKKEHLQQQKNINQSKLASPYLVFSLSLSKFSIFNYSSSFLGVYSVSFSEFGVDFPFGSKKHSALKTCSAVTELLQ